ncbi:MAG TPA: response regulator [Patescibacteria group bacterium]|nr:response regulator [Patescibacteria group bacterium]
MDTQSENSVKTPRKILCIEDEQFISELYTRALVKKGYQVKAIYDGKEGLNEALTNNYDIILLDLMIPNVSGIDILRALKSSDLKPPIKSKIVIITNLEQSNEVKADIEKQADGYLVKADLTPYELAQFVDTIK